MKSVKLMMMTLIMSLAFVSCNTNKDKKVKMENEFNSKSGHFIFTNFSGRDSVAFDNTTKIDKKSKIEYMIFDACLEAKQFCNNPLTFKPKSALLYTDNDTNVVSIKGEASNAYGVPGEINCISKFIDNKLIENSSIAF